MPSGPTERDAACKVDDPQHHVIQAAEREGWHGAAVYVRASLEAPAVAALSLSERLG